MSLPFEWDPDKSASNRKKHGVTFEEAATAFGDARALTIHDEDHSVREDRFITLGISARGRLLVVVHSDHGESVRIISSRLATTREEAAYVKR